VIVVARLDRFDRSAVDVLGSIRWMTDAGARLVSVEDNFDGITPMGRFAIGTLTLIAELELERIKENWSRPVLMERRKQGPAATTHGFQSLGGDHRPTAIVPRAFDLCMRLS